MIPLPEGLEPFTDATGKVIVNGTEGGLAYGNRILKVSLGTVPKSKSSHFVSIPIQVSPDFNKPSARISAMMKGILGQEAREETLGAVMLEMPQVTLDVQELLISNNPAVSGLAPAGSTVKVYDGGVLIGSAVASTAGLWSTKVVLIDRGSPSIHLLRAVTEANGVTLQSPEAYVEYDKEAPQLLEVAMSQLPAGRWVSIDPLKGVYRLPYTVVPGNPFAFQLRFNDPAKVKNVQVYINGQEGLPVQAKLEGDLYRAIIPTKSLALGPVYVSYDKVSERFDEQSHDRTIEEIRKSLPREMRDFEVESVTPFELRDGIYQGSAAIKLPQFEGARMTVTLKVKPDSAYEPTEEELEAAEESGMPLFNAGYESTETDKSKTSTITGVLPLDFVLPSGAEKTSQLTKGSPVMISASGSHGWGALAEFTMEVHTEVTGPLETMSEINDVVTGGDYMEYAQKINRIMYLASSPGCFEDTVRTGKQAAKALLVTVGGEVAKVAVGAWVGAMALEGVPGIAAGIVGDMVTNQIDNYVDSQIDAVGTGYNVCKDDELPYDPENPNRRNTKIADPKWIYDPSGYVYEAVADNRLEDVKSTVMYLDSASNSWRIWDAEPYGQTNPHETDGEGRYGWDVPPGKWKVVWEKQGYDTAVSRELDVPPPHTDVNEGLVSYEPPIVASVLAAASTTESFVDIEFSKHLKTSVGIAGAVTLIDASGTPFEGTAQFINVEQSPMGEPLSRTIRFIPNSALTAGGSYRLKVQAPYIVSYAGIPMEQDYEAQVTALAKDEEGPIPTAAVFEGYSLIRVTFNEPLTADDVSQQKFEWVGRPDAIRSVVPYAASPGGEVREVLVTLAGPAVAPQEGLSLKLLPEAVRDFVGNASTEATIQVALPAGALSTESRLSGLTVSGGSLDPAFHPDTTSYTVTVNQTAEEITLTGTPMDTRSKLFVEGLTASGGAAKTVRIPDDGIIVLKVQAEDPNAASWYTLTVIRTDVAPSPGGVYIPPVSPSGNLYDIGIDAVIERSTEDGLTKLKASIQQTTVERLVRSADDGSVFTVHIDDPADAYLVRFPALAFRLLSEKKAELYLQVGDQTIKLRTDAFEVPEGAESILVTIKNDKTAAGQSLQQKLTKANVRFKPKSGVLEVRFQAEFDGNRVETIRPSDASAVRVEWRANGVLVYRFDSAADRWTYVIGHKNSDTTGLEFPWYDGGLFAVWTYDGTFADTRNHWARRAIDWMTARLYITGYDADTFQPNRTVTRAEFAAMLVRILGLTASNAADIEPFKDVQADSWYVEAVEAAVEAGLAQGVGDGQFKPDDTITREQMTVMVWRAYKKFVRPSVGAGSIEGLSAFTDEAEMSGWAREAIASALKEGLIQGVGGNEFDPLGTATRAQAATLLHRIAEKLEK